MNKKVAVAIFAASFAIVIPAHAQFGGLLGAVTGGGSDKAAAPAGDVDAFLATAAEAHTLMQSSADKLFEAVATKDEIKRLLDEKKAAETIADPSEREARLKKVEDDKLATLAKVDYAAKAKEMETGLDQKHKDQIGASVWNFMLAMLKDKQLADQGMDLVSSIGSNPMLFTKLGAVKGVISSIASQAANVAKIGAGLQKLATVAKVDTQQIKISSKPKEIAGD